MILKARGIGIFLLCMLAGMISHHASAQRECGQSRVFGQMQRDNPAQYRKLREGHRQQMADFTKQDFYNSRATAQAPIPVVFHILVDTFKYITLGRDTGIMRRVISQLAVLNEDYNRANPDSFLIPAIFKLRYGNAGFRFALANTTSANTIAPGVEVKILHSNPVYQDVDLAYTAKENSPVGLAAWDVNRYLNVWVLRITTSGAGTVLGITTPLSFVGSTFAGHVATESEIGVALNYGAFGAREFPNQYFIGAFERGRTLTHEIGHYFELYHTWGDDDMNDGFAHCPGDIKGGVQVGWDDDISDTPPQARRTYCDFPNHVGSACPNFPLLDSCSSSLPGIMFMNYMDYVDDVAMQMFTTEQAARMRSYQLSEEPQITQHPELSYTPALGIMAVAEPGAVGIMPNPATGAVRISLERAEGFRGAAIVNMLGQAVASISAERGVKSYDLNLSAAPRGIYLVQCHYDGGTVSQKLILE